MGSISLNENTTMLDSKQNKEGPRQGKKEPEEGEKCGEGVPHCDVHSRSGMRGQVTAEKGHCLHIGEIDHVNKHVEINGS